MRHYNRKYYIYISVVIIATDLSRVMYYSLTCIRACWTCLPELCTLYSISAGHAGVRHFCFLYDLIYYYNFPLSICRFLSSSSSSSSFSSSSFFLLLPFFPPPSSSSPCHSTYYPALLQDGSSVDWVSECSLQYHWSPDRHSSLFHSSAQVRGSLLLGLRLGRSLCGDGHESFEVYTYAHF